MNVYDYIKQHKHKNYCEAIVYPDGSIEDAVPGHIYKLMDITGLSRDVIDEMMPVFAAPIEWLVSYTKCISLWFDFYLYNEITNEQQKTLDVLKNHEIIYKHSVGNYTDEYNKCEYLKNL